MANDSDTVYIGELTVTHNDETYNLCFLRTRDATWARAQLKEQQRLRRRDWPKGAVFNIIVRPEAYPDEGVWRIPAIVTS
jgi:hypothetical protein